MHCEIFKITQQNINWTANLCMNYEMLTLHTSLDVWEEIQMAVIQRQWMHGKKIASKMCT